MTTRDTNTLDIQEFRARLEGREGSEYWRTLDELADSEAFSQFIQEEFPRHSLTVDNAVDRRSFMKLMGASLAMGGLAACVQPTEKIIPYVKRPEDVIPGMPLYFATTMTLGATATGLLVESHTGRPTKVEGNPDHPASLGGTDAFAQAAVLSLYDPDRSQTVRNTGTVSTWGEFLGAMQGQLTGLRASGGRGFRLLTPSVISPTLGQQIRDLLSQYPAAQWHQYDPATSDSEREGSRLAYGRYLNTYYRFDRADVVLTIDSDVLGCQGAPVRYAHDFAERRRVRVGTTSMNRLYAIESTPTTTGSIADHRLAVRSSEIPDLVAALAAALGVGGASTAGAAHIEWIAALARDLRAHAGSSLIVAGATQPPEVHALVHAMNSALGNSGKTVVQTEPIEIDPTNHAASIRELVTAMNAGEVSTLLILGTNPVYSAPPDLKFAEALQKVPFRAHLSLYFDETSALCQWHVPELHFLESWSDARAFDGTASIVQPLIAPLYGGRSAHEVIGSLTGSADTPYDAVRSYWRRNASGGGDFDTAWKRWLNKGFIADTALPPLAVSANPVPARARSQRVGGFEIVFRPDPTIYDGRFANNAWLQELPKPITKLTWDNAALMSPATARKLGLKTENWYRKSPVVEIRAGGTAIKAGAWVVPGHADDSITLHLGYGRERAGTVGNGAGVNANLLRRSDAMMVVTGAEVVATGEKYPLASTQLHQAIDQKLSKRGIVRSATLAQFISSPEVIHKDSHAVPGSPTMYKDWATDKNEWGMVIDTGVCTGCNGCVIACQSENNIAVVGKEQVLVGREMHWIRIDHYYRGTEERLEHFHQPVPCMHCENAPCEPVCPVEATSHSDEGINEMTYNRCVGTRYCANNCPYKVRRFNFLSYSDYKTPSLKLMRNPDVTVRTRGVMEKCSYCIQRVNAARIEAEKDGGRAVRDGEVVTACQQACPTRAITFGNIADPESAVTRLKKQPHNYVLLEEVNTQPRTSYLASIRNPNPEMPGAAVAAEPAEAHHG